LDEGGWRSVCDLFWLELKGENLVAHSASELFGGSAFDLQRFAGAVHELGQVKLEFGRLVRVVGIVGTGIRRHGGGEMLAMMGIRERKEKEMAGHEN